MNAGRVGATRIKHSKDSKRDFYSEPVTGRGDIGVLRESSYT